MKRFLFLVVFSLFYLTPINVQAQSSTESGTGSSPFEFDLSSSFGGLFFQDQIGLQIARQGLVTEGFIDKDIYTLGSNDLISINIKGAQPVQMRGIVINPQGQIVIPVIGVVNLKGKTISEAQQEIEKKVSETFNNSEVVISLDQPRSFTIHVNGGIPHPGKYVIPAQSRTDFAIYQSITDGVRKLDATAVYSASSLLTKDYSFRNIKITHQDGTISYSDLITYYATGSLSENPIIRDGDLITIHQRNPSNARISLTGAVRSPFEIEFLDSDTPQSLLSIAGGFATNADTTKLIVLRKNFSEIKRIQIDKSNWDTFELHPNDRIIAQLISNENKSASIWIAGEVNLPGNFPIVNGSTSVLDILNYAGNFTSHALPKAGYLIRSGSVKNEMPNKFNVELMKRTSDQLLQGFEYLELESRLSQNRVYVDLTDNEQLRQVKLFDGDRLFVPRDENTIFVFGQVNNPGYFPYHANVTNVTEYIRNAGGFSLSANKDRVFVIKAGNKTWYRPEETTISSGDMIFVDRNPFDELNAQRTYDLQKEQLKNTRIQLLMTGLTTITSVLSILIALNLIN